MAQCFRNANIRLYEAGKPQIIGGRACAPSQRDRRSAKVYAIRREGRSA